MDSDRTKTIHAISVFAQTFGFLLAPWAVQATFPLRRGAGEPAAGGAPALTGW